MDEFFAERRDISVYNIVKYTLAVSCKVLIERFGWVPIKSRIDDRMRIIRFIRALEDEIRWIENNSDLKQYNADVKEKYGIEFVFNEQGEE